MDWNPIAICPFLLSFSYALAAWKKALGMKRLSLSVRALMSAGFSDLKISGRTFLVYSTSWSRFFFSSKSSLMWLTPAPTKSDLESLYKLFIWSMMLALSIEFLANFFSKSFIVSRRDLLRYLTSTRFLSSASSWNERFGKRGSRIMETISSSVMALEM